LGHQQLMVCSGRAHGCIATDQNYVAIAQVLVIMAQVQDRKWNLVLSLEKFKVFLAISHSLENTPLVGEINNDVIVTFI
jgi:hypothetical protein